jgi:hypothetical protein
LLLQKAIDHNIHLRLIILVSHIVLQAFPTVYAIRPYKSFSKRIFGNWEHARIHHLQVMPCAGAGYVRPVGFIYKPNGLSDPRVRRVEHVDMGIAFLSCRSMTLYQRPPDSEVKSSMDNGMSSTISDPSWQFDLGIRSRSSAMGNIAMWHSMEGIEL